MILIIWFVCWRGLTSRDDALDPHALSQKQLGDDLLVCPRGKVIELIIGGPPANVSIYGRMALANSVGFGQKPTATALTNRSRSVRVPSSLG